MTWFGILFCVWPGLVYLVVYSSVGSGLVYLVVYSSVGPGLVYFFVYGLVWYTWSCIAV